MQGDESYITARPISVQPCANDISVKLLPAVAVKALANLILPLVATGVALLNNNVICLPLTVSGNVVMVVVPVTR